MLICILIFSADFFFDNLSLSRQKLTSWRLRVDVESKKTVFLSKRFTVSCGDEIVWISVTAAYLWFFYAVLHFSSRSLLIYHLMILRTPKNDTNELISYSFGERERFMVIALLDSKKPNSNGLQYNSKEPRKKSWKIFKFRVIYQKIKKCCEIIHQMRLQFVVWVLFAYFTPGGNLLLFWHRLNVKWPKL